MGVLVLSDFIAEVRAGLGNRTDLPDARIVVGLNLAQLRVSRFWDFQEMKKFDQGICPFTSNAFHDKFMTVPVNLKTIHTLVLLDGTSSRKLKQRPWRQFDRRYPSPETDPRSRPQEYSRWGNKFVFYPIFDKPYIAAMRLTARPTPFDNAVQTMTSDYVEKDDIIINLTLEYFWRSFGRDDKADRFSQAAMGEMAQAIKKDDDQPDIDVSPDDMAGLDNLGDWWNNPFVKEMP